MLSQSAKEGLVGEVLRTSFEVLSLDEIAHRVLPPLESVFKTNSSLLFRNDETGKIVPLGGKMFPLVGPYQAEGYYRQDLLDQCMQRENPVVFYSSRAPLWKDYLKGPVFHEFTHPNGVDNYIQLRLTDTGHNEPGNVSLMLVRLQKQPDFTKQDDQLLQRVLPALQTAVRRSLRVEDRLTAQLVLEAMLEKSRSATLALDLQGKVLWASDSARALLPKLPGFSQALPEILVQGVRRLGALALKRPLREVPPSRVVLTRGAKPPARAELHLARTKEGAPFVMVELESDEIPPILAERAANFHLTAAETEVLHLISLGLSEDAIARRLFVSKATVHTHAIRVFSKLGVHSRVQA
ncbi:MAG TPA: LuxR C-terminal-related transcriptional regulator, partial [bacterium]|nr:LuxR C-terminal-related transcriptional regulator [bacterium]